jgi:hypothetical protein
VEDLEVAALDTEGVFIVAALTTELGELTMVQRREWVESGKWLGRLFNEKDAQCAETLIAALRRFFCEGDPTTLYNEARNQLQRLGGPLHVGESRLDS